MHNIYIYIYICSLGDGEHSCEELLVAPRVLQSSSEEISTPVTVKRICKQRKNNIYTYNSFAYAEIADSSVVRYPTDIKSAGYRSQLEASSMSRHTDEL